MSQLEAALPTPRVSAYPKRWIAAAVMIIAALMDMIDATIANVALPTIRADLGASATQVEWIVSAYLLPFAALLLVAGRLGDLLGRRRLFVCGVATFREIFAGEERATAFGMYGAMAGFAAAIGVLSGGLLTDGLGWRSIFYINLPVAAAPGPAPPAAVAGTRPRAPERAG